MADKRKAPQVIPPSRPRNPYVAAALARHAGCHGKPRKTERQQSRQRMQRSLGALLRGEKTEFDIDG